MTDPNPIFDSRLTDAQAGDPREEIADALRISFKSGQITELRAFGVRFKGRLAKVVRGFYDDCKALIDDAVNLDLVGQAESICITVDRLDPALLKHGRNELQVSTGRDCTTKADVLQWTNLVLDFDQADRKTGAAKAPATDDEHRAAINTGLSCASWLHRHDVYAGVVDSGNGCQLRLPVDLPPNKDSQALITRLMAIVSAAFDDETIRLDPSTATWGRVCKLAGTVARKGTNSPERPWRRSHVLVSPLQGAVNNRAVLERLAGVDQSPDTSKTAASAEPVSDLQSRLDAVGLGVRKKRQSVHGSIAYELETCPFADPPHQQSGKAWLVEFADGGVSAGCHAARCHGKGWKDFVQRYPAMAVRGGDDHLNEQNVVCLADVKSEPVAYLWNRRIAVGKVTLWYGDPGSGKGYAAAAVTAAITAGKTLPGEHQPCRPGDVLICNGEDNLADVLRPRIERFGGDVRRVHVVTFSQLDRAGLAYLEGQAAQYKPALVIIDPLYAFSGSKVDLNRGNQTRPIFTALARIAERYQCAIVVIHHTNKSESTKPMQRAAASQDIIAAARIANLFGASTKDETQRAMLSVKSNVGPLAPALGYTIDAAGEFRWTGESQLTPKDLLGAGSKESAALDEAVEFLQEQLASGPKPAREVLELATAHALSYATIRRALKVLKIAPTPVYEGGRKGAKEWTWALASPTPDFSGIEAGKKP